jgi:hypothetical protein
MAQPPQYATFTTTSAGGLLDVLKNQCGISQAFNPAGGGTAPPVVQFDAIWDTGATNSCITQAVIDGCGLAPIGIAQVHGVGGATMQEAFLVNIHLPGPVGFASVRVTRGQFIGGDILIGMDIISQGDFAVSNHGGVTKFSYRIPSQKHIDFYEQFQALQKQFGKGKPQHGKKKK